MSTVLAVAATGLVVLNGLSFVAPSGTVPRFPLGDILGWWKCTQQKNNKVKTLPDLVGFFGVESKLQLGWNNSS